VPPHRAKAVHTMERHGEGRFATSRHPNGFQFADDTLTLPLHSGTHIDCLCHVWSEGQLYNGFPGDSVRSTGARHCSADKLPPIVTRGVLLDCVGVKGAPFADGEIIGLAEVKAALERANTQIRSGDAVVLRTGWHEAHTATGEADFNCEPGLDVDAALFLAEAGAAVIGADNYAIEVLPFPAGTIFPVHQRLIRDYGIPLLEGLVLKPLADAGATEFLLMAAALPVVGGTGSPLTPVAVF
jgi:kynurenine formamidase